MICLDVSKATNLLNNNNGEQRKDVWRSASPELHEGGPGGLACLVSKFLSYQDFFGPNLQPAHPLHRRMAPPATLIEEDDAYHSASDSDFEAHDSPSSGEESASSGDEGQKKESRVKKRKNDDLEIGSGDEGIIAQGRKKRRKKAKGKKGKDGSIVEDAEDNEDDGTGIRVRLRSGRGG